MKTARTRAFILLLTVSLIWGAAAPVIKYTLAFFPPLLFIVYRFGLSSLVAIVHFLRNPELLKKADRDQLAVGAFALFSAPVTLGLLFLGMEKTESMTAQLVSVVAPLLVIMLSAWIFRETITRRELLGSIISFAGALVIVGGPIFIGNGQKHPESGIGNLIILIAFIFDSVAALLSKYLMNRNHNPTFLSHLSFIVGFITLAPLLLLTSDLTSNWQLLSQAPLSGHLGVLYMALLSGTIAYAIRSQAIKDIELSEATLFTYLNPLWGAPLAVFWLGETVDRWYIYGGVMILGGILLAETKKYRKISGKKAKLFSRHQR
jgi:drug/metabolite transporter (DMT)-like permease